MAKKAVPKPKMYISGIIDEDGKFYIRWEDEPDFNLPAAKKNVCEDLLDGGDKYVIFELTPVAIGDVNEVSWRSL